MGLAIYVHIPYCLQRCTYCDFATYEQNQIIPIVEYFSLLKEELRQKARAFTRGSLPSVYFGGGTPSLGPAEDIVSFLEELTKHGFYLDEKTEVTLEINPATINADKMEIYLAGGINRFSVGVQTFHDSLLQSVKRKHSAQQAMETLDLLKKFRVNYSMDLLFALPGQSIDHLKNDLDQILRVAPPHISPYCLTVSEGHVLHKKLLDNETQLKMFELIRTTLQENGYEQYEISNFTKPGWESRHNLAYWNDQSYWGLGLSAHSYDKQIGLNKAYGIRFWNPNSIGEYKNLIQMNQGKEFLEPQANLPENLFEIPKKHQSLTDFCHTSLRRIKKGLEKKALQEKFGLSVLDKLQGPLSLLVERGLLERVAEEPEAWTLSPSGVLLANQVFLALTFLEGDI